MFEECHQQVVQQPAGTSFDRMEQFVGHLWRDDRKLIFATTLNLAKRQTLNITGVTDCTTLFIRT